MPLELFRAIKRHAQQQLSPRPVHESVRAIVLGQVPGGRIRVMIQKTGAAATPLEIPIERVPQVLRLPNSKVIVQLDQRTRDVFEVKSI